MIKFNLLMKKMTAVGHTWQISKFLTKDDNHEIAMLNLGKSNCVIVTAITFMDKAIFVKMISGSHLCTNFLKANVTRNVPLKRIRIKKADIFRDRFLTRKTIKLELGIEFLHMMRKQIRTDFKDGLIKFRNFARWKYAFIIIRRNGHTNVSRSNSVFGDQSIWISMRPTFGNCTQCNFTNMAKEMLVRPWCK